MSRTFCRMDAWSNDERMAGPKWNAAQLIGKSQKGRYEHEKDLNHLPTKSNLTLLKCHVVSFTENFYTLTPRCPGPISIHSKKRYGVTSPTYLGWKKKTSTPILRGAWPSQPTSPQNLFPRSGGVVKNNFPLPTTRRLVPLKDGTLFARKEKEWQCQGHDHRGICDVIGVLKFQRDLMGDLIDSLAGPKYVHVNVFVCVCVLKYMYVHISILYIYYIYTYIALSLVNWIYFTKFHQASKNQKKIRGFRLGKKIHPET